jgi:hypothetical protein
MNDRPGREAAIFIRANQLPAHKRAAFLEQACAGDENLRHKLESLLNASDRSGAFLEKPVIPEALTSLLREIASPNNRKRRSNPDVSLKNRRTKRKEK